MIIFNKYKTFSNLNLEDSFEINLGVKKNIFRVYSWFNHSKRLIRSLLLLHFYIYSLYPFSPILFRSTARYHIKLNSLILILVDPHCYDSYFRF